MTTFLYSLILILLVALLWQSIKIRELKFSLKNQKLSHVSSIKRTDLKRSDLQDGVSTTRLRVKELPKMDKIHYTPQQSLRTPQEKTEKIINNL